MHDLLVELLALKSHYLVIELYFGFWVFLSLFFGVFLFFLFVCLFLLSQKQYRNLANLETMINSNISAPIMELLRSNIL